MKKVGILGATGAVGREIIAILEEKNFPLESLRLFASRKSAGINIPFKGIDIQVEEAAPRAFDGLDILFGAAGSAVSRQFKEDILASGAVFIDNSSAFRHHESVPLVIPQINPESAKNHRGIIANPNCSTIISLMALWPVAEKYGLKSITASTYQAVSGAGAAGLAQLESEMADETNNNPAFVHKIAKNIIPAIGSMTQSGYTDEEEKLLYEGRKILGLEHLAVSCTCVRVPVERCHSISLNIETERPVTVEAAKASFATGSGVELMDDYEQNLYPMPLFAQRKDSVFVGRIRADSTRKNGLCLWCCGDQLRKGAALNAVEIAYLLV